MPKRVVNYPLFAGQINVDCVFKDLFLNSQRGNAALFASAYTHRDCIDKQITMKRKFLYVHKNIAGIANLKKY